MKNSKTYNFFYYIFSAMIWGPTIVLSMLVGIPLLVVAIIYVIIEKIFDKKFATVLITILLFYSAYNFDLIINRTVKLIKINNSKTNNYKNSNKETIPTKIYINAYEYHTLLDGYLKSEDFQNKSKVERLKLYEEYRTKLGRLIKQETSNMTKREFLAYDKGFNYLSEFSTKKSSEYLKGAMDFKNSDKYKNIPNEYTKELFDYMVFENYYNRLLIYENLPEDPNNKKSVLVNGYFKKDGTFVKPHRRYK